MESMPTSNVLGKSGLYPDLRSRIQGMVITPDQADYHRLRKPWNLIVEQYPNVIVAAENSNDVIKAVQFAAQQGLGVAVQCGGHGVIRNADDAVLILTAGLSEIQIDAVSKTARVGAGVKWGPVLQKAQEVGLAPLLGSSSDVGAVGYTLGGGMGWLARKYGLAIDSVVAFEVVTADGKLRRASETENSDLFWALRGGGGGFGVVTAMEIRLYPVAEVYAGNLIYPVSEAVEIFRRFRDWTAAAPEELTASIVMMNYPPLPFLPEMLRGKSFVMVRGCYCGTLDKGKALVDSWRAWKAPLIDDFIVRPFSEADKISNDPVDPMPARATGAWMKALDDAAIETLIRYGLAVNGPLPVTMTEIRMGGGAISKVDRSANAFGDRSAVYSLEMVGATPGGDAVSAYNLFTDQVKRELGAALTGTVYPNFLEGEEAWNRTQQCFLPDSYLKLKGIKAKYDPENLFRFSYNIPPA